MKLTLRAAAVTTALIDADPLSVAGASNNSEAALSPFGIAWGYPGNPEHPVHRFIHNVAAGGNRVILFWQPIEREKGRFDWSASDDRVIELNSPDEGVPPAIVEHGR